MKIELHSPIIIHELGKRANQEDCFNNTSHLFVLCDGMGGHEKGEVASQMVTESLTGTLEPLVGYNHHLTDDELNLAIECAYSALDAKAPVSAAHMGTTLTLLAFHQGGATVAHIGDSRIYHIRPSAHSMLYKSMDHSLVYELFRAGEISFDEMSTHPRKNIITRAMQPGADKRVKADIAHIADIQKGDCFYLCSDGMLEQLDDFELLNLLCSNASDEKKRQQFLAATADNADNHTAFIVRVKHVEHEAGDENNINDEATARCNALRVDPLLDATDADDVAIAVENVSSPSSVKVQPTPQKYQQKNAEQVSGITTPVPMHTTPYVHSNKTKKSKLPLMLFALLFLIALVATGILLLRKDNNREKEYGRDVMEEHFNSPREDYERNTMKETRKDNRHKIKSNRGHIKTSREDIEKIEEQKKDKMDSETKENDTQHAPTENTSTSDNIEEKKDQEIKNGMAKVFRDLNNTKTNHEH